MGCPNQLCCDGVVRERNCLYETMACGACWYREGTQGRGIYGTVLLRVVGHGNARTYLRGRTRAFIENLADNLDHVTGERLKGEYLEQWLSISIRRKNTLSLFDAMA